MNPKALIFDCDGTLVDSMPIHWRAWDIVCKRNGVEFTEERHYALGGIPSVKILQMLKEEQGLDIDPIAREARGKTPMAVATGGRTKYIKPLLKGVGILDWFGAVVTADDVENHKPAPDTFLEASALLGVPPEECRAYEDTDLGMEAIHAAGMEAVDVRQILGVLPS